MRILYMLNSLGIGGAERQVIALAERMAARGHSVKIVVLTPRAVAEWHTDLDFQHLDLRKTPLHVARGAWRAVRSVRGFRPEILHSHNFHGNILGRLLKLALPSVRVVSTIHNVYEGGPLRTLAYRMTGPLSCCTAAVSRAAAERAEAKGAVAKHKCLVIANGIDVKEFSPCAERRTRTRDEVGVNGAQFVWLTAGRIVPAKDYPNLLQAFALVHAAQPCARLWIAGEGEEAYTASLRRLASELRLDDAVRWLGMRRDMPGLLDASDAFVLASAWEGMPLVVGEAMAMGKPVVATDVGGVGELVGACGEVVPAGNSEALAKSMTALMRSRPDECGQVGGAARARICAGFSMDAKAVEWEALYRSVCGESG